MVVLSPRIRRAWHIEATSNQGARGGPLPNPGPTRRQWYREQRGGAFGTTSSSRGWMPPVPSQTGQQKNESLLPLFAAASGFCSDPLPGVPQGRCPFVGLGVDLASGLRAGLEPDHTICNMLAQGFRVHGRTL